MTAPATRRLAPILLLAFTVLPAARAQTQAPPAFDSTRAYHHVREQVALGPRPAASEASEKVRHYLIMSLGGAGYTATEQPFEASTPVGRVKMANVVATLAGDRPERILLASHFDTKPINEFRFVGANDGGSSTGALLELARVLKVRPKPRFTLEFVFFDGEEAYGEWREPNHTYGSRQYVTAARAAGTLGAIRALVLLDMIGDRSLNLKAWKKGDRELMDSVYSGIPASLVGREQVIEVGPMSGKSNVTFWLEKRGITASEQVVDRVFQRAKSSRTVLTEAEILAEVYR